MRTSRRIPLLRVNIDENGGGDTSQVFRHEYCLDHAFHAGGNGRSQWVGTVAVISQLKPGMLSVNEADFFHYKGGGSPDSEVSGVHGVGLDKLLGHTALEHACINQRWSVGAGPV